MAKYSAVDFFLERYTLPNAPLLIGFMISKSLMEGVRARGGGWLAVVKRGETGGFANSEDAVDDCRLW